MELTTVTLVSPTCPGLTRVAVNVTDVPFGMGSCGHCRRIDRAGANDTEQVEVTLSVTVAPVQRFTPEAVTVSPPQKSSGTTYPALYGTHSPGASAEIPSTG